MKDDVRRYIYGALIVFVVGVLVWVGFLFVNACGFSLACNKGKLAVERTPIPTLLPANMPVIVSSQAAVDQCRVAATDLIGAWVEAGSPEADAFEFVDISGQNCTSTFEEVRPLFIEGNRWYAGSTSCVVCHTADVATSSAQLDLGTYAGITAGSRRADAESKGTDILGAGKWVSSPLYDFITTNKADVPGHGNISSNLLVSAGTPLPEATPTP